MTRDPDTAATGSAATDGALDAWLRAWLGPVERRVTPSGAEIALAGDVVAKVHHRRTRAAELTGRLRAVGEPALAPWWVQPLEGMPRPAPDGRVVTLWPRVAVLDEDAADHPWAEAGRLLAGLHRAPVDPAASSTLPAHGGPERLARALDRARHLEHPARAMLVDLGARLVDEVAAVSAASATRAGDVRVVHGDWHLGQLAATGAGLRLLDVDDLGLGDPAWDLARPAGFWAAGALDDASWETFLDAYRDAGGPAVPVHGDPWPALDTAARAAVFVAAVRGASVQPSHSNDPAHSLLETCARM